METGEKLPPMLLAGVCMLVPTLMPRLVTVLTPVSMPTTRMPIFLFVWLPITTWMKRNQPTVMTILFFLLMTATRRILLTTSFEANRRPKIMNRQRSPYWIKWIRLGHRHLRDGWSDTAYDSTPISYYSHSGSEIVSKIGILVFSWTWSVEDIIEAFTALIRLPLCLMPICIERANCFSD